MSKISFIGAGSMAEAVVGGIVKQKVFPANKVFVTNKENGTRLDELTEKYNIVGTHDRKAFFDGASIIVIATKPHDVVNALKEAAPYMNKNQLVISVVAGISTETIEKSLGLEIPVIRTMPNTSASIGDSATAICKGQYATEEHLAKAKQLFDSIGTVSVVEEEMMHVVTAISGSGPAYIYYLVEAMIEAAKAEGLDEQVADQLITQTVIGAGRMLQQRTEPISALRENVTSPNGTTFAGLQTLRKYQFHEAVVECVKSATKRSIELGKEN